MKRLYFQLTILFIFLFSFNLNAQISELWGNTYRGGAFGGGTVFKTNADGSNLQVIKIFSNSSVTDGFDVRGVIAASNKKIYGLTERGGIFGGGTLFMIDPETNQFNKLYDFLNHEGINPICSLMEID